MDNIEKVLPLFCPLRVTLFSSSPRCRLSMRLSGFRWLQVIDRGENIESIVDKSEAPERIPTQTIILTRISKTSAHSSVVPI